MASGTSPCSAYQAAARRWSRGEFIGRRVTQFECEQVAEQVMEAKPCLVRVKSDDEPTHTSQCPQCPLASARSGHQVAQLTVDPCQQRAVNEQLSDIGRLIIEHLLQQVFGNRPIAAGERRHEPVGFSGCVASEIAASRRPATHPSVRS